MKKVLCGIALVLAMAIATSCGCNQTKSVVEEEAVETVDSLVVDSLEVVEAPADSLQVAE